VAVAGKLIKKIGKRQLYTKGEILTYLITPWCRVLLEKLTGLQLVKKFPAFHGTRKFITKYKNLDDDDDADIYLEQLGLHPVAAVAKLALK